VNIGISGITGFVGRHLARRAAARGHRVIGFSRRAGAAVKGCAEMRPIRSDALPDLAGCEAVIHLAGESVIGFWTPSKQEAVRQSRVRGTRRIVEAMGVCEEKPRALISASGVGYYGDTGAAAADERAPEGAGFLAAVARDWEAEATRAIDLGVRVVRLRIAMVLGADGGALPRMLPLFRAGLGAVLGSGEQWMSWIHVDDLADLLLFAAEDARLEGPVNGAAPGVVTNAAFTAALAKAVARPALLRVPAFAIRCALGGFSAELLENRRVVPRAALDAGFAFAFPSLEAALADLLKPSAPAANAPGSALLP
jgi:uncharacterized protein (TIGR01777 family)